MAAGHMLCRWLPIQSPLTSARRLNFTTKLFATALPPPPSSSIRRIDARGVAASAATVTTSTSSSDDSKKRRRKEKERKKAAEEAAAKNKKEKRRTRSDKEHDSSLDFYSNYQDHVPVMLREVVDVFSSLPIRSFVDCTIGAAGHSSAIIKAHPGLEHYIGMDVDPEAHAKARAHIGALLLSDSHPHLKAHTLVTNFKRIKSVIGEADGNLLESGVDAILMDLGMSSMQVNNPGRGFSVMADGPLDMRMDPQAVLKAEDILNYWPDAEVGRVLRDYGEESNWKVLQNKIVLARSNGGIHSTAELIDLIRGVTHDAGGRPGWIKTATRVFQALRIAVNDELNTLERALKDSFGCLAPGGRLAVISFHSLEDRIVKQTFLSIVEAAGSGVDVDREDFTRRDFTKTTNDNEAKETWIRQTVRGQNGSILTKRPITPSEEEESLNRRCRSAKLRVIEKAPDNM
ncbi:Ribosomal RNA small subunit methyltransferase H [Linum perenne]